MMYCLERLYSEDEPVMSGTDFIGINFTTDNFHTQVRCQFTLDDLGEDIVGGNITSIEVFTVEMLNGQPTISSDVAVSSPAKIRCSLE